MECRLEFYDPLYETITIEKGLPTRRHFEPIKIESFINPCELIACAEFARLAYLKQVGLAWLVFPSATHTRFSHSIGCWWLGRYAESLIKVRFRNTGGLKKNKNFSSDDFFSLGHWLDKVGLREEFYLSLLLHDIGHGPLSHVIEHNELFRVMLNKAGISNTEHEQRGADLLTRTGPLPEKWDKMSKDRYGESKTFRDIPWEKFSNTVSVNGICYLMTGNLQFLQNVNDTTVNNLKVVKELVSGLLDLDRIDHYARDSYFSGLKQVTINVRGFLSNLRLVINMPGTNSLATLSLTNIGASYATSLLFSKKQILSTMFRNAQSIAYHTMVNWALTEYLKNLPDEKTRIQHALEIALMDDDTFLTTLSKCSHSGCKYVVKRIRSLQPYYFVKKIQFESIIEEGNCDLETLKNEMESFVVNSINDELIPSVLMYFDKNFWSINKFKNQDWLDTEKIIMDENPNRLLKDHPDFKDDFKSLNEYDKAKYMWIFVKNTNDIQPVQLKIQELISSNMQV